MVPVLPGTGSLLVYVLYVAPTETLQELYRCMTGSRAVADSVQTIPRQSNIHSIRLYPISEIKQIKKLYRNDTALYLKFSISALFLHALLSL